MRLVENVVVTNELNNDTVKISWDIGHNDDFDKFYIYRSPVSYSSFTKIAEVDKSVNEYQDTLPDILPVNEWYYKVAQADDEGNVGELPFEGTLFTNYDAFNVPRITGPFQTPLPTDQDMKYYFNEIRSRNLWILQNDGEPMILLKKKYTGTPCPLIDDADGSDQCPRPLDKEHPCYGTGFVGGYYPSLQIMARRINQQRTIPLNEVGIEMDMRPTLWTIYTPRITEGDILIDRENRRWEVTDVHRYHWRELITHQNFQVMLKKPTDIIYKIPVLPVSQWADQYWGMGDYVG